VKNALGRRLGMLKLLPEWYGDAESKIWKAIWEIRKEQEINEKWIRDSRRIQRGIQEICSALVVIFESDFPKWKDEHVKELRRKVKKDG
jgi:hypothetical protein